MLRDGVMSGWRPQVSVEFALSWVPPQNGERERDAQRGVRREGRWRPTITRSYHPGVANNAVDRPEPSDVTRLLRRITRGTHDCSDELFEHVYGELRAMARAHMAHEKPGQLLQPTALVHEAYLRLLSDLDVAWDNRAHFYGAAAEAMRRILVEHARKRNALKRGGGRARVPLDDVDPEVCARDSEILAVDEALSRMKEGDARASEVVRLRFFAGLSIEETALALDVSPRTVRREWHFARAKLYRDLRSEDR